MGRAKRKPVVISPQAKEDIEQILSYLKENWSQKVVNTFLSKLFVFYNIVSINPRIFGYYNKTKNIRNYAIAKQTVIYYRNRRSVIEIITVFDTRQSPKKLKQVIRKSRSRK